MILSRCLKIMSHYFRLCGCVPATRRSIEDLSYANYCDARFAPLLITGIINTDN